MAAISVSDLLPVSLAFTPTDICLCGCQLPGSLPPPGGAQERRWQPTPTSGAVQVQDAGHRGFPPRPHRLPETRRALSSVLSHNTSARHQPGYPPPNPPPPTCAPWGWPLQLGTCVWLPDTPRVASGAACRAQGGRAATGPGCLWVQIRPCLLPPVYTTSLRKSCPLRVGTSERGTGLPGRDSEHAPDGQPRSWFHWHERHACARLRALNDEADDQGQKGNPSADQTGC